MRDGAPSTGKSSNSSSSSSAAGFCSVAGCCSVLASATGLSSFLGAVCDEAIVTGCVCVCVCVPRDEVGGGYGRVVINLPARVEKAVEGSRLPRQRGVAGRELVAIGKVSEAQGLLSSKSKWNVIICINFLGRFQCINFVVGELLLADAAILAGCLCNSAVHGPVPILARCFHCSLKMLVRTFPSSTPFFGAN